MALYLLGYFSFQWRYLLVFSILIIVTDNLSQVDLPQGGGSSGVTFPMVLGAIMIFGPALPAMASALCAVNIHDFKRGMHPYKAIFNSAQLALSTALSGLVYLWSGGPVLMNTGHAFQVSDFPAVLLPTLLATFVFFFINTFLVSIVIGLANNTNQLRAWLQDFQWVPIEHFSMAPIGLAVAQIYMTVGTIGVVLMILPLMIARQTFHIFQRLRSAYLDTVKSLISALEAKDVYTRGHSERVAELAEKIGRELDLTEDKYETLRYAGILHDIGKIGTARHILRKPAKLSQDEYQLIRLHPEAGALILGEVKFLSKVVPIIFHHHEAYDGSGYTDGIRGEEIPLLARVLSAADAYDAMTSPRPYRAALSKEAACEEMIGCAGKQFDPEVVKALLKVVDYQKPELNVVKGQLAFDEAKS